MGITSKKLSKLPSESCISLSGEPRPYKIGIGDMFMGEIETDVLQLL